MSTTLPARATIGIGTAQVLLTCARGRLRVTSVEQSVGLLTRTRINPGRLLPGLVEDATGLSLAVSEMLDHARRHVAFAPDRAEPLPEG